MNRIALVTKSVCRSRRVQSKALDSLHLLLRIMSGINWPESGSVAASMGEGHLMEELRRMAAAAASNNLTNPNAIPTADSNEDASSHEMTTSRSTRGSSHESTVDVIQV